MYPFTRETHRPRNVTHFLHSSTLFLQIMDFMHNSCSTGLTHSSCSTVQYVQHHLCSYGQLKDFETILIKGASHHHIVNKLLFCLLRQLLFIEVVLSTTLKFLLIILKSLDLNGSNELQSLAASFSLYLSAMKDRQPPDFGEIGKSEVVE